MKKKILTVAIACCLMFTAVACGGTASSTAASTTTGTAASSTAAGEAASQAAEAGALERYDYVADMNGNSTKFTIAQNMKSVKCEIESMGLDLTCYCTIEDNVMTLTELVDGNKQFYQGLSATPFQLNADGTATPVES